MRLDCGPGAGIFQKFRAVFFERKRPPPPPQAITPAGGTGRGRRPDRRCGGRSAARFPMMRNGLLGRGHVAGGALISVFPLLEETFSMASSIEPTM